MSPREVTDKGNKGWASLLLALAMLLVLIGQTWAEQSETVTYYHTDGLGSVIAASDENGNLLWRERYRPFGERLEKGVSTDEHALYYTGKAHDEAIGLTYFGARYYDPVVGRFMSIDAAGVDPGNLHSFNRYAYANNNPYRYVDPDGNLPILVPFAVFLAKEIGAEAFERATGLPALFSATGVAKAVGKKLVRSGAKGAVGREAKKSPIIIGENMRRVKEYADKTRGHAYRPWKNEPFDYELAMKRNKHWIQYQKRQGREIIDIGPDFQRRAATGRSSPFYEMERQNTKGYGNRKQVFDRSGNGGGVPGLDF